MWYHHTLVNKATSINQQFKNIVNEKLMEMVWIEFLTLCFHFLIHEFPYIRFTFCSIH